MTHILSQNNREGKVMIGDLRGEGGREATLWVSHALNSCSLAVAQLSEHLQIKQEAPGSIPGGCPGFFRVFQLAYKC